MNYSRLKEVSSPSGRWRLHTVLYDFDERNWSAAEGQWERDGRWYAVLVNRWNSHEGAKVRNPKSRGLTVSFVVPDELDRPVLEAIPRRSRARRNS